LVRLVEQPKNGVSLLEQYCASGCPDVFAQIMRAYGGMVFSVCLKVTKDPADAEDASQAVFLTLAVQCKTGAVIRYLGPWLKKVANRSSLDLVRSRKRRSRREAITAERRSEHYGVLPGDRSETTELQEIIRAELDHLPAKYRMPLVLHYFGGLGHDEISREMNCTTAALGVRLHRARKMLGKRLSTRGVTLQGVALTTALASLVTYFVNEKFVQSTTHAMMAMHVVRPHGIGAFALGAHLPASLGIVPQLMQEVAQSMARARLKYATVALAISVTCLGGAAEAVRHLPDSLRPNLEFLSPTKALERFFGSPHVPRLQNTPAEKAPLIATKTQLPEDDAGESLRYETPLAIAMFTPKQQPVLAYQFPTTTPPVSTHTPHLMNLKPLVPALVSKAVHSQPRLLTSNPPPQPAPLGATARTQAADAAAPVAAASASNNSSDTLPVSVSVAPTNRDPNVKELTAYIPSPTELTAPTANLARVQRLQTVALSDASLVAADSSGTYYSAADGSTGGVVKNLNRSGIAGPRDLSFSMVAGTTAGADETVLGSQLNSWLVLRPNDLYVFGDRRYDWSDRAHGIERGDANSVSFTLDNAIGNGVFSIERLATNTTLAPARPTGHTFIGVWSADTLVNYDGIDLTVHYDEVLAASLGLNENILKLWVYDGESWIRIIDETFSRDMASHTLAGSFDGKVIYFGVSAPEPSVLGVIAIATATLLRRRRH